MTIEELLKLAEKGGEGEMVFKKIGDNPLKFERRKTPTAPLSTVVVIEGWVYCCWDGGDSYPTSCRLSDLTVELLRHFGRRRSHAKLVDMSASGLKTSDDIIKAFYKKPPDKPVLYGEPTPGGYWR